MTAVGVHDAVQAADGLSWLRRPVLSGPTSWLQEDGGRRQEAARDNREVRQDRNSETQRELIQDQQGPERLESLMEINTEAEDAAIKTVV